MNTTKTKAKSERTIFPISAKSQIIVLFFAVLICSIFFFEMWPVHRVKEVAATGVDGAVPQVEEYIKKNILKDLETVEIIHWSKLIKSNPIDMIPYRIGLVYKIKQPNGDFKMESKVFDLDQNKNVMFEVDVPPFGNLR